MEIIAHDFQLNFKGYNYNYRVINTPENVNNYYPLILLSGAFQDKNSWKRYVSEFNNEYKIVLVDLPGTGDSDFLPDGYGLEFLTEALNNIVIELKTEKIELICVSYGSPVGYYYAKKYPEKISHLLLFGTMKEIPDEVRQATIKTVKAIIDNRMHDFAMGVLNTLTYRENPKEIRNFKLVERILYCGLVKMNEDFKNKFIENTKRLLEHKPLDIGTELNSKALIMTGEYDIYTKPEYCKEIAKSIKNSIFISIQNADHLFHLEQFNVTVQLIRNFLQNKFLDKIDGLKEIKYY